jgi:hypothetical protein
VPDKLLPAITLPRPGDAALALRATDAAALVALAVLPIALLHARALADVLLTGVGALFLLRCVLLGAWDWTAQPWVGAAAALWLWLVLATAIEGPPRAVVQAVVFARLPLFSAACAVWALRSTHARRVLGISITVAAVWIAAECWQQFATGFNVFGDRRWLDGALTGPFVKPHAGAAYLAVLFPALLPPVLRLLRRPDWRARAAALLLLAAAAATMVLIGQRMPTLLMVLGLVTAGLLLPALRLPALAALLVGAVVLAATPVVSPPTYGKLVLHFLAQMDHFWISEYGQIYLRALAMVHASPLFGVGVDGFRAHCLDAGYVQGAHWFGLARTVVSPELGCNIHPHNYWLEMATAGGVPALLGFATLVALWLAGAARGLDAAAQPMRAALLVMLVVLVWPVASTSSLFVVDAGGWLFVAAGWALAEAASAEAASDRQPDARA